MPSTYYVLTYHVVITASTSTYADACPAWLSADFVGRAIVPAAGLLAGWIHRTFYGLPRRIGAVAAAYTATIPKCPKLLRIELPRANVPQAR